MCREEREGVGRVRRMWGGEGRCGEGRDVRGGERMSEGEGRKGV